MSKGLIIGGKSYPFRMTMGALLRFKRATGKEISEMGGNSELVVSLLYCCVVAACNADGVEFTMYYDTFADSLTMEEFTKATQEMFQQEGKEQKKSK